MNKDTLYIVVPCYNEEEVLEETISRLTKKLDSLTDNNTINKNSKILFVDDGSKDKTWTIIENISKQNKLVTGISLSNNKGHQNALLAGLLTAKEYADIVISMDADLQDDIEVIDEMINKYNDGNEIVYGVRKKRKKDSLFKKLTAKLFYNLLTILGVECIKNHADYRLTSKKVLNELEKYNEVNLFLRGIFPNIGFKHDIVYYNRGKRFKGKSKYPLRKMINFALDGITSFSIKPLKMICNIGVIILLISIIIMIYSLIRYLTGNTVTGWTFLSISIWFIGGLQMISIGIIGEYIGKIYYETKNRPRYIIDKNLLK